MQTILYTTQITAVDRSHRDYKEGRLIGLGQAAILLDGESPSS